MRCPRCGEAGFNSAASCPRCGFSGPAALIEELSQLNFLLAELETWGDVPPDTLNQLRERYGVRRRRVEVALGLREPPLDLPAARAARLELAQIEVLLEEIPHWLEQGCLTVEVAQEEESRARTREVALKNRLLGAPWTGGVQLSELAEARFLAERLAELHAAGRLASDTAYAQAAAELASEIKELEIEAGLRPAPLPPPSVELVRPEEKPPLPPSPPPRPRRQPLTWERVWETLLSERTLRALLFVGALLLFAAAVSLVVWNWEAFDPWLQVTFMTLFTGIFYALGWYVRERLHLRGSGIALSAVASLLIPIDFYAFYLSNDFLRDWWAQMWLLASVVGLGAYVLTVYLIQAEFFGYLVGVAAGSALAAAMQVVGVNLDWWQTGLILLALAMAVLSEQLHRREGPWRVLAAPLWHVALAAAVAILAVAFAWAFTDQIDSDSFYVALTVDWWLAGALFLLAARRFRHRMMGLAAAACFPMAVWLTQRLIFDQWAIGAAWHALGWALLAPGYLLAGWALLQRKEDELGRAYGQTAVGWGVALIVASTVWALADVAVAAVVHPLLAAAVALAVWLWRRPNWSLFASLLLLTGTGAWVASREATVGQLGLAWALLAVLHVLAALGLRRARGYDGPAFLAGWLIAGLALLPPALTLDWANARYTLGNFAAISGWLALLLHHGEAPGLERLLASRSWLRPTLFHWAAAVPLLPWIWLVWIRDDRPVEARLGLAYMALAWLLLGFGVFLRRRRWAYGRPWQVVAHASNLVAIAVSLVYGDQGWVALTLLLAAGLYFASARLLYSRWWLLLGGGALPVGLILGLDWLGWPRDPIHLVLAAVVAGYVVGAALLERVRRVPRSFLRPLYTLAQGMGVVASIALLILVLRPERTEATLLWAAGGQSLLAVSFGLCAWLFDDERRGHLAAWLGVFAGGLVAVAYSQGRGSSAAKAALLAIGYVLAERGLHQVCRMRGIEPGWRRWFIRAWKLYRRPLLLAGWSVSVGAIGLALLRNLLILGGGRLRETWSIVGLSLVTGLYAFSAWLFRRQRFAPRLAWFAGALVWAPWTLLAHLGWYVRGTPTAPAYALSWAVLALIEWLVGAALAPRFGYRRLGRPLEIIAHLLLPFSLLWGVADVDTSVLNFGLGVVFYLLALVADRRRFAMDAPARARFLYPAAALLPVWAVYLLAHFAPSAVQTTYGFLLLGFTLPALGLGRWLERRERTYGLPLYLLAYGTAIVATALVAHDRPALIVVLLFDAAVAAISAWTFREPLWVYPAAAALPLALVLALAEWAVPVSRRGWALIALGGLYLLAARLLRQPPRLRPAMGTAAGRGTGGSEEREGPAALWLPLPGYATPVLAAAFVLIALGLVPSGEDRMGALVGYAAAALLYTLAAVWLRQPLLLSAATGLAVVPYWVTVLELGVARENYGLALWPGIVAVLLLAHGVDWRWGVLEYGASSGGARQGPGLTHWGRALVERVTRWWALPLYAAAYLGAAASAVLSLDNPARLTLTLLLAALVYGLATYRFRLRGWLLLAAATAQLAALAAIRWLGWWDRPVLVALAFAPVTWATALAGLAVERFLGERPPLGRRRGSVGSGWSRPLYALLLVDLIGAQLAAFLLCGESAGVSLAHALLLALLATAWASPGLVWSSLALGLLALIQRLLWVQADTLAWPGAWALLALGYGVAGYLLTLRRTRAALPERLAVWERPLGRGGWLLSGLSLLLMFVLGVDVVRLTIRAAFGHPLLRSADLPRVQMVVSVLAVLGLFYLLAAIVDRLRWLGYAAVGMLLGAWSLEWLLVWGMREVQWYAVPAGLYLLGVGYLEWTQGSRALARWIDRAALLLLLGSSFWQSIDREPGWPYALLMGVEGGLILWWGSARRLRRFLFAGVAGVTIDVVAQLIEPLLSVNRWIVFGVAGALFITLGILVERNLERVRAFSQERLKQLEQWQ